MKKGKTKTVGSGITKHEKASSVELTPENAEEIVDSFNRFNRNMHLPWGGQKGLIDEARRRLAEIEAEAPCKDNDPDGYAKFFKPHEDPGWYFRQIDICALIAEFAVAEGRPWEAVFRAMKIGHHLAEFEFKEVWETRALKGERLMKSQALANVARRRNSQSSRYEMVKLFRAKGHSWERSYHLAAKRLGDSPSTVKKDCLKLKKLDQSVD